MGQTSAPLPQLGILFSACLPTVPHLKLHVGLSVGSIVVLAELLEDF